MITNKKQIISYVSCTYILFWIVFVLTGCVMLWLGEGLFFNILLCLCSWTPTITLFVLFKRLYPNNSIKNFYTTAFKEKIKWKTILITGTIQISIFIVTVYIVSFSNELSISTLLNLSPKTLVLGIFMTLIQGATGEESGWRGFLQPSIEKKFTVINTSLIVGLIWGFWHTPLWLLTSGYSGIELVQYIIAFMITILSISVVIGICYNHCKNLFVPICIHFMFNFSSTVFTGNALDIFTWFAVLYAMMVVGYILWFRKYNRITTLTKQV